MTAGRHDLAAARTRLAARQHAVLTDLLAGRVPPGFEPRTTAAAAAQLLGKRRHEALGVAPELAELPGFGARFAAFARTGPRVGCAHDDVAAFLAASGGDPEVGWWRAEQEVVAGRRRAARVRSGGRWVLVLGVGPWCWRIAVRAARVDPTRGGGSRGSGGEPR